MNIRLGARCLRWVVTLLALVAWLVAVVDFMLANISELPRPYLLPARVFRAAHYAIRAFIFGRRVRLQPFRIWRFPCYRPF